MSVPVVIDTNIFVGAVARKGGINRRVLELCFKGDFDPLMSNALYLQYEDVLARDHIFEKSAFTAGERQDFFDDFCSISEWVHISYRWRPNLRDEGDNHVIELAIAGGAQHIVTNNTKDFKKSDLILPDFKILNAQDFMDEYYAEILDESVIKRFT